MQVEESIIEFQSYLYGIEIGILLEWMRAKGVFQSYLYGIEMLLLSFRLYH